MIEEQKERRAARWAGGYNRSRQPVTTTGRYNRTGPRAGVDRGRGGCAIIVAYTQGLLRRRIVRYALVGGIGIPVNLLALALFLHLMGDRLYPLASACAFEVSTTVNFVL